jgi:hypothetical protein
VGGKVIAAGVVGLLVGVVGGAAATWGLDPADEPAAGGRPGTATFVVFAEPALPDAEVAAVETELQDDPRIERLAFLDHEEAVATYREAFADEDEDEDQTLDRLDQSADLVPTAFRFVLPAADESVVEQLMTDLRGIDGVARAAVTLETRATAVPGDPVRWE